MNTSADNSKFIHLSSLLLGIAIATGVLLRFFFFKTSVTYVPVTTDEALATLIAQSIYEGARPLLFWGTPYQLPVESYLMAFFGPYLANGALSARLTPALLAGFGLIVGIILVAHTIPRQWRWLGWILLLVPSAYITTLQSAYFIPQYTMSFIYAMALPLGVGIYFRYQQYAVLFCIAVASGFALSNHLLSLPLVAALSCCLLLHSRLKIIVLRGITFSLGCAIGLVPYLLTFTEAKASAATVTGTVSLQVAVDRIVSAFVHPTLSTILGFTNTLFPDLEQQFVIAPGLAKLGLAFFWFTLVFISLNRIRHVSSQLLKKESTICSTIDVCILTIWLSLFSFIISSRADSGQFRYLLPVAWHLPFIVAYACSIFSKKWKLLIAVPAISLTILNIAASIMLIFNWQSPRFTKGERDLPRLRSVRKYLRKQNIDHCYASFWHVNRLTFESKRKLICTQAYNERFRGWPLHFKDTVDTQERVAFVLSNTPQARFTAKELESILKRNQIQAEIKEIWPFFVYHDFKSQSPGVNALTIIRKKIAEQYGSGSIKQ